MYPKFYKSTTNFPKIKNRWFQKSVTKDNGENEVLLYMKYSLELCFHIIIF